MKTRFFALAALALALAACNNDNEILNNDGPVAARFIADIAPATRASGTTWDNGDRIGVTDIGNDTRYGNVPFILKNGKFEAEEKVIYIEDAKTHTFRAYYPYNAAGGTLAATTDATAQQNQPAIDFLFASGATGDKDSPVVNFTDKTKDGGEDNSFHHRMSRITLTFEAGDGVDFSVIKPERYTLDDCHRRRRGTDRRTDHGAGRRQPHVIGHPLPADSCLPAVDCELQKSKLSCHAHRARRRTAGGQQLYLYRQGTQQRH